MKRIEEWPPLLVVHWLYLLGAVAEQTELMGRTEEPVNESRQEYSQPGEEAVPPPV